MGPDVLLFVSLKVLFFLIPAVFGGRDVKLYTMPLFYDENHYFEIMDPEELHYLYRVRMAKDFGTALNRTLTDIHLIPVQPSHGCGSISNHQSMKNSIAFIARGECSFLTKTIHAEEAGATAAIIYDNDQTNDDKMVDMITDETSRTTNIPAFFLMGKDGYRILETLQQLSLPSAVITIPINVTGIPAVQLYSHRPPWTLW